MKKFYTLFVAVLITASVWAQSPEKMSYQAVVRNSSNNLTTNQAVGMQISILQGGATGMAVYVETQTPTTNANGLVSLEIGTGTVVSGDFTTIDWANDTYFIKTETDPTGGTNYTITGVNQLLSVPYALHAKTAESIIGTVNYTETDPIFGASVANGIIAVDTANWNNHTVDTDTQLDSTGVASLGFVAGGITTESDPVFVADSSSFKTAIRINTQAIKDTASQIRADIPTVTTYSVGDFAQGGVVFWVDETGQHGLACAKEDQSTGIRWYAGTFGVTRATGDGPFSGELNTSIIISSQVSIGDDGSDYAAQICNELQITEGGKTYGDWYLPSKEEVNHMYNNQATINTTATANSGVAFASADYWSSTESNSFSAWIRIFATGTQSLRFKSATNRVRAVRAF